MKPTKISVFLCIVLSISYSFSQNYVHSTKDITKVEITASNAIILKTHDAPNFLISSRENQRINKKASGLQPTFGKDNTGFNVFVEQINSTLKVESFQPRTASDLVIYLPETMNVFVENRSNNNIVISNFTSEIEAKADNGEIYLVNITGPVIVENARGNTNIVFKDVHQNSPISIINSHGDIDVTIPSNTKTTLEVSVPRGELYTDLELVAAKKDKTTDGNTRPSRYIKSKLNNGGVSIILVASRGNVYLRKK